MALEGKPIEPEHPLIVEGAVLPGNTRFMAMCLLEELLRGGMEPGQLRLMSADPSYQALYAARACLGAADFNALLASAAARLGVHRVTQTELANCPLQAALSGLQTKPAEGEG